MKVNYSISLRLEPSSVKTFKCLLFHILFKHPPSRLNLLKSYLDVQYKHFDFPVCLLAEIHAYFLTFIPRWCSSPIKTTINRMLIFKAGTPFLLKILTLS